jgi:pimeloyl-ACP methyl ester carboxylesterase
MEAWEPRTCRTISEVILVFLDHRGFASAPGDVDVSALALHKVVDDVERARKTLGLGRIAVIGHAGHALMALEYAKKYPANVSPGHDRNRTRPERRKLGSRRALLAGVGRARTQRVRSDPGHLPGAVSQTTYQQRTRPKNAEDH